MWNQQYFPIHFVNQSTLHSSHFSSYIFTGYTTFILRVLNILTIYAYHPVTPFLHFKLRLIFHNSFPPKTAATDQMAAITSHWWRRLVNAYEMKIGMVCLQYMTVSAVYAPQISAHNYYRGTIATPLTCITVRLLSQLAGNVP